LFEFIETFTGAIEPFLARVFKIASLVVLVGYIISAFALGPQYNLFYNLTLFISRIATGVVTAFVLLSLGIAFDKIFEILRLLKEMNLPSKEKKEPQATN